MISAYQDTKRTSASPQQKCMMLIDSIIGYVETGSDPNIPAPRRRESWWLASQLCSAASLVNDANGGDSQLTTMFDAISRSANESAKTLDPDTLGQDWVKFLQENRVKLCGG